MIRFQFVDDAQKNHSVKRICEVLKLNRSSYYKWKNSSSARRKRLISDAILGARVTTVFTAENGCYGAKRITAELKDQIDHDPVNHKRVARIMRSLGPDPRKVDADNGSTGSEPSEMTPKWTGHTVCLARDLSFGVVPVPYRDPEFRS